MAFLKRLTRSRSNSQSYVDDYNGPRHDSKLNSASYDDHDYGHTVSTSNISAPLKQQQANMYNPHDTHDFRARPSTSVDPQSPAVRAVNESAPDLLTRAFNEAVRPYTSKLAEMEGEIGDLRAEIEDLLSQRREVHAWIDKRGLRPDVPPSIASLMDQATAHNPTHAAATLNAQLDRKITIVNFDLHRLQDDLNDSLPTPSFSACMLKFLPDIERLAALPAGPRHAFDLVLKLGGNLNSHGGLESGDEDDLRERRAFYAKLDDAMVDIVRGRFRDEGDTWGVQREVKRIEKTGAYLATWGVSPYFQKTLDVMHDGGGGSGAGNVSASTGGEVRGGGTPPAYQ